MQAIKNVKKVKWRFILNEGFTLVEMLLVILILSIIAAMVLPQFHDSSMDTKNSTLQHNLRIVRNALELYAAQHNGEYPNAEDHNTFIKQLMHYTNLNQQPTSVKSLGYPYGPYLKNKFPENPLAENKDIADIVYVITANDPLGTFKIDPKKGGWLYKTKTGEFIPNMYTDEFPKIKEDLAAKIVSPLITETIESTETTLPPPK